MKVIVIIAVVLCCVEYSSAAPKLRACEGAKSVKERKQKVDIIGCTKSPCRLRKNTIQKVDMRFTAEKDLPGVQNVVSALLVGINFPFIGVDGTDACPQIFEADGTTRTTCPLKAGKEYVYKNEFEIYGIYPLLKTVVHWSLRGSDGTDVLCFEVPVRITN